MIKEVENIFVCLFASMFYEMSDPIIFGHDYFLFPMYTYQIKWLWLPLGKE